MFYSVIFPGAPPSQSNTRLEQLEKRFEEADLEKLRRRLEAHSGTLNDIEERLQAGARAVVAELVEVKALVRMEVPPDTGTSQGSAQAWPMTMFWLLPLWVAHGPGQSTYRRACAFH